MVHDGTTAPRYHPHAGVDFTIEGGDLPTGGTTVTADANGEACLDGLVFGSYDVTESVPAGYVSDDATKGATVSAVSTCGDGNEALVEFDNTPLTDITVSVNSQVDGVPRRRSIACRPARPCRPRRRPTATVR